MYSYFTLYVVSLLCYVQLLSECTYHSNILNVSCDKPFLTVLVFLCRVGGGGGGGVKEREGERERERERDIMAWPHTSKYNT